jgi:hypothetical protein
MWIFMATIWFRAQLLPGVLDLAVLDEAVRTSSSYPGCAVRAKFGG